MVTFSICARKSLDEFATDGSVCVCVNSAELKCWCNERSVHSARAGGLCGQSSESLVTSRSHPSGLCLSSRSTVLEIKKGELLDEDEAKQWRRSVKLCPPSPRLRGSFTRTFANRYVEVIKVISSNGNPFRIDRGICWLRHGAIWRLSTVWEWSLGGRSNEWEPSLLKSWSLCDWGLLSETQLN